MLCKLVITTTKNEIVAEVRTAVEASVEKNIIGTINSFIDTSINNAIVGFVDSTIRQTVNKIIAGESKELSMSGITDNATAMLSKMGSDAQQFFSLETVKNMLTNTSNDIISQIKWSDIQEALFG